jgi:hypothetical protein
MKQDAESMRRIRSVYRILFTKPEVKRPLERQRRRWGNDVETELR